MTGRPEQSIIATLGLLDPTADKHPARETAAIPVLDSLAGKRIGLLDNSKTNVSRLLATLGDALMRGHGASGLVVRTKLIYSRVAAPDLIDELSATCDAVVTAIGD